eukprot:215237-Pelagomonas_calceolata.AAC.1
MENWPRVLLTKKRATMGKSTTSLNNHPNNGGRLLKVLAAWHQSALQTVAEDGTHTNNFF